ncbi:MAG: cytochrome P450 [Deltaproteobacteria bacterium]|nr:cytochrome P450 [Deltaproteobacteria bacterium]
MIYDPYSREVQEDPFPTYAHFLEEEPCHYNPKMDFYSLFRFEDVWDATLDWQTFSSRLGPLLENRTEPPPEMVPSIIGMDPPRQVAIRNVLSKAFTPRRIASIEPEVRRIASSYLDAYVEAGGGDIQEAFSNKLPMDVISVLMGIPKEFRDGYRSVVERVLMRDTETGLPLPPEPDALDTNAMLFDLLKQRRADPRDDLITVASQTEFEDVDGTRRLLSDREVVTFAGLLTTAGSETTVKLIGNCLVYLWQNPDQRKRMFEDPAMIPLAVEEILRYDPPSHFQGRVAQRDVSFHGVTIPEGARVALVTGASGRDPREFAEPDRIDIERKTDRQLYFGYGPHFCIGKSLARQEARVALEEIGKRFPNYEVLEEGLTRTYQAHVRGFATIPLAI